MQGLLGPTKSDEAPGPGPGPGAAAGARLGLDLPPSLKSPHVEDEADRFDSQGNYQLVHNTWVRAMQGVAARSEIEGMQGLLSDTGYRLGERDLRGTSINGQFDDATKAAADAYMRNEEDEAGVNALRFSAVNFPHEIIDAPERPRFDAATEEKLGQLDPRVHAMARLHLEAMKQAGMDAKVSQAYRSQEDQDDTYAQGRSKPGIKVTNAKGGESYHNFKLAYDVALRDKNGKYITNGSDPAYRDAARLGQRYGLEWGGNFHSKFDAPHYQYSKDMSLPDLRQQYPVPHGRQGSR